MTTRFFMCGRAAHRPQGVESRPKTLWPFPVNAFKEIDFNTTKQIISVELSQGQMIYDVKLAVECKLPVSLINRVGGMLLDPQEIVDRTKKIMEVK